MALGKQYSFSGVWQWPMDEVIRVGMVESCSPNTQAGLRSYADAVKTCNAQTNKHTDNMHTTHTHKVCTGQTNPTCHASLKLSQILPKQPSSILIVPLSPLSMQCVLRN